MHFSIYLIKLKNVWHKFKTALRINFKKKSAERPIILLLQDRITFISVVMAASPVMFVLAVCLLWLGARVWRMSLQLQQGLRRRHVVHHRLVGRRIIVVVCIFNLLHSLHNGGRRRRRRRGSWETRTSLSPASRILVAAGRRSWSRREAAVAAMTGLLGDGTTETHTESLARETKRGLSHVIVKDIWEWEMRARQSPDDLEESQSMDLWISHAYTRAQFGIADEQAPCRINPHLEPPVPCQLAHIGWLPSRLLVANGIDLVLW